MRLDRISYEYADGTLAAYDFHPRLTVIDVHPSHRSALIGHLLSSLSSAAAGVHVEATFDDGAAVVAFRPHGAAPRVIDVDAAADVTGRFATTPGVVDLLAPLGLSPEQAAETLLASGGQLVVDDPTEVWIGRLAGQDPDRLLAAAGALIEAETELRQATDVARTTPEAAAAVSGAFASRSTATSLEKRHNRIRAATLVIGSALPVGAVVGLNTIGNLGAVGLIAGSVALAGGCLAYERRLARAVEAEYDALDATGSPTYTELDGRVAGTPLSDAGVRDRLIAAAARHRQAATAWQELAGDIPAPWVSAHATRVREAAALRADLVPTPAVDAAEDIGATAGLLAGLTTRAAAVRELCPSEPLPLFLDDPLAGLRWEEKIPVLEFLGRLSERQQMIVCTDDLEVLNWARLEEMAGDVAIVDVNPGRRAADDQRQGVS